MFDETRIKGIKAMASLANGVGKIALDPRLEAMVGFTDVLKPIIDSRLVDHALHISSALKPAMDSTYLIRERQALVPEPISPLKTASEMAKTYAAFQPAADCVSLLRRNCTSSQLLISDALEGKNLRSAFEFAARFEKFGKLFSPLRDFADIVETSFPGRHYEHLTNLVNPPILPTVNVGNSLGFYSGLFSKIPEVPSLTFSEYSDRDTAIEPRSVVIPKTVIITNRKTAFTYADESEWEELITVLGNVDRNLSKRAEGALLAFRIKGPDYQRQVCVSLRELVYGLINRLCNGGSKSRRERLFAYTSMFGGVKSLSIINNDVNNIIKTLDDFINKAIHSENTEFTDEEFSTRVNRFLIAVRRLAESSLYRVS